MKPPVNLLLVLRWLKPFHRHIAYLFLFLFSFLLYTSCSYYRKKTRFSDQITFAELNKNIAKNKQFVLVTPINTWVAKDVAIVDDKTLSMRLSSVEYTYIEEQLDYLKTSRNQRVPIGRELLQQLVLLHVDNSTGIEAGEFKLNMENLRKVEIYDADVGRSILAILGSVAGVLVILGIIIALTKSSCPFLYVYDGEDFVLAAETFGGAIYPGLERSDFIPLSEARPLDGRYQFKLRNELKEIQYINKVKLHEARIPENARLGTDQEGHIYAIRSMQAPHTALTDSYRDVSASLTHYDSMVYSFDNNPAVNNLLLSFNKPADIKEAKLIVRAKGTLWFDYVFGEFLKLFGTIYNDFASEQSKKTPDQMGQWSKDQHIPLSVSIKENGQWKVIEALEPIGPLTEAREIVVPLADITSNSPNLEIRLSTGFNFWEIDYVGVDYSTSEEIEIRSTTASSASFNNLPVSNKALDWRDSSYVIQERIGDVLDLSFTPQFSEGIETMVFLEVGGYYSHIRDFKNKPDLLMLESFRKPGRLSEYSKELFDYNAGPLLASGREE